MERCGRNEAVGAQRSFGNTQQHVFKACRLFAFRQRLFVRHHHFGAFHLFTGDEVGVARVHNVHAAQHLADDNFDVLVGNLHTLQAIHFLHLLHDVARQLFNAFQAQNIVRIHCSVDHRFAFVHHLAVMHQDLLVFGNQRFVCHAVQIGNYQALFAFGFLTERYRTGDFRQHARIFGDTRFKQLGHARQTAGNVAGFGRSLRDTC